MTRRKSKAAQLYKRTISEELFAQWQIMRRTGDPEAIAATLNISKPTIDKALIYGCVHQQKVVDGVTKFFMDRLEKEAEDAKGLARAANGDFSTTETIKV